MGARAAPLVAGGAPNVRVLRVEAQREVRRLGPHRRHRRLPLPRPSPVLLTLLSSAHNLVLLDLSASMAAGCAFSAAARLPSPRSGTDRAVPLFF